MSTFIYKNSIFKIQKFKVNVKVSSSQRVLFRKLSEFYLKHGQCFSPSDFVLLFRGLRANFPFPKDDFRFLPSSSWQREKKSRLETNNQTATYKYIFDATANPLLKEFEEKCSQSATWGLKTIFFFEPNKKTVQEKANETTKVHTCPHFFYDF